MAGKRIDGFAAAGGLLAALLLPCAEVEARANARELPYETLARSFLDELGAANEDGAAPALDDVLEQHFARIPLGAFELLHPSAHLGDPRAAADLKKVAAALLDAERVWLAWIDPQGAHAAAAAPRLATLRAWVDGIDPRSMGDAGEKPLADEGVEATSQALAKTVRDAAGTSTRRFPIRIALMPQRSIFVEFLCFAGWSRPELRSAFWVAGIETWTHSFLDDLQIYAMEYAEPGGSYQDGLSMRYRSTTGLEEQIVQLATGDLLDQLYEGALPPSFLGAVGNNLVIELFGQVDTRVDGDLAERRTAAREMFVPGGLPQGGVLPKNRAESSWRSGHGEGYFIGLLRGAQKAGRKAKKLDGWRSSHPNGSFVLETVGGDARYVVGAPILGPAASDAQTPPPPFEGEYQEFLRAYRSAFLHWLQLHGKATEPQSRAAFAGLFGALARPGDEDLVGVLEAAYGQPLSDADASDDCLEGRFLAWLAKQKETRAR